MKNDWNINSMFLPFTAIFGEILFDDPFSSVGFGIVFLELTSKSKNCLMHKMCCPKKLKMCCPKSSKCNLIRVLQPG